jgi:hypothetical protein
LGAGETLMPLEEIIGMLHFASATRDEGHEAQRTIDSNRPPERWRSCRH